MERREARIESERDRVREKRGGGWMSPRGVRVDCGRTIEDKGREDEWWMKRKKVH